MIDPRHHGWEAPRPTGAPHNNPWADRHGRHLAPSHEHVTIINNFHGNVRGVVNGWNRNDHGYYWHDWGGHRIAHHYDVHGYHWFGWYIGSVYFWTRYYDDMYWWYDPYYHRWCYRRSDRWWWQDPDHTEIVYYYDEVNSRYYRYEPTPGGVEMTPDPTPPVDAPPTDPAQPEPESANKVFYSQDGTRVVEISGDGLDAYLRDTADPAAFEPTYLDSGVTQVRFRLDESGAVAQILLLKSDDSFSLFDPQGNPSDGGSRTGPAPAPGETLNLGRSMQRSQTFDLLNAMGGK